MRADWATLNGKWEFEFDDRDAGLRERWFAGAQPFSKSIVVPYTFQSKLSGIGDTAFHDVVWYRRTFSVPAGWQGRRVLLNFGAVDYEATDLGERRGRGTASGRPRELRARRHRPPEARRQRRRGPRLRSRDGHDHPARQAVLEAEVREHLLHADDGASGSRCGLRRRARRASAGCASRPTSTGRRPASRQISSRRAADARDRRRRHAQAARDRRRSRERSRRAGGERAAARGRRP